MQVASQATSEPETENQICRICGHCRLMTFAPLTKWRHELRKVKWIHPSSYCRTT